MSNNSNQSIKSKFALIFVSTIFAVTTTVPAGAANRTSDWTCLHKYTDQQLGRVIIWWGHKREDAAWACNSWLPQCANSYCRAINTITGR
ncbi:hypothetical protein DSM106972_048320 [Dulcicalothrix desertica PCC 7102]|uniref:Uncharacterized protein n=1 Tax=Dulcicalothrix desertica PCC 7102 TaxID=232991 RepID=A0A433VCX0_9CYAN|nr:hypothetical protein [Dulcicalothrix desertica]RUT03918.1 hypothetical protein DSM106972_048320 [Dulcicalothrix desertica PCC 7102]TWH43674.1 hypothetical protein CAL7102_07417 [Dulcicalothrix desertica PCC 7102]